MAQTVETVQVVLSADNSSAVKSINEVKRASEDAGNSGSKLGSIFSTAGKLAAAGLAAASAGAVAFAKSSVSAFNDAQIASEKFANAAANQNWSEGAQSQLNGLANNLQRVGVIEGDAITQGQAQLGTFNLTADAVARLTPAMADLAANQTGAASTGMDLANNANLIGKAMTGNAGALTRVGVTLTDSQKAMIENGTEMEKASAIADALSSNYGGLNERLGQTAQGGLSQLKNSFGDVQEAIGGLLTGQGDLGTLTDSITTFVNTAINNVPRLVGQFGEVIPGIVDKIVEALPDLISNTMPALVKAFVSIIQGVVNALPTIISALVDAIPTIVNALVEALPSMIPALVEGFIALFMGLVNAIDSIIAAIVPIIPQIIQALVDQIPVLIPALIEGFIALVLGVVNALPQIIQALVDALPTIVSTIVSTLLENLPVLIEGFIKIFMGVVGALPRIIGSLISAAPKIIEGLVGGLVGAFPKVLDAFGKLFDSIGKGMSQFASGIGRFFGGIGDAIWKTIKGSLKAVLGAIPVIGGTIVSALHLKDGGVIGGKFANGGLVSGFGGPRADRVPAMLSNGEAVLNARAVSAIGVDAVNFMNENNVMPSVGGGNNFTVNVATNNMADPITFGAKAGRIIQQMSASPNAPIAFAG